MILALLQEVVMVFNPNIQFQMHLESSQPQSFSSKGSPLEEEMVCLLLGNNLINKIFVEREDPSLSWQEFRLTWPISRLWLSSSEQAASFPTPMSRGSSEQGVWRESLPLAESWWCGLGHVAWVTSSTCAWAPNVSAVAEEGSSGNWGASSSSCTSVWRWEERHFPVHSVCCTSWADVLLQMLDSTNLARDPWTCPRPVPRGGH